jgi:hypothetical protein
MKRWSYNDTLLHAVSRRRFDQLEGDSLHTQGASNLLNSTRQDVNLTQVRQRTGLNDQQEILTIQRGFLDQQFAQGK